MQLKTEHIKQYTILTKTRHIHKIKNEINNHTNAVDKIIHWALLAQFLYGLRIKMWPTKCLLYLMH